MEAKLIVDVLPLRQEGWALPRFRWATAKPFRGILTVREETIVALNRSVRVATLKDAVTGQPVLGLNPLFDTVLLHMTAGEWVLTGFERISSIGRDIDFVQSWRVIPFAVEPTHR